LKIKDQKNFRVGMFIGQYDPGGSHTRDFIKCLAERNIHVDLFLCNPMGFKAIDTFSYVDDRIQVYFFKRDLNLFGRSNHPIIKNFRRINALLIVFYQYINKLIIQLRYQIGLKNENLLIPKWVQRETNQLIRENEYRIFIGVEAMGLVYAGMMGKKHQVSFLYHSYELFTKKFPNGEGKKFLQEFYLLKKLEKKYHMDADATIIQDEERKNVLYGENCINEIPEYYMPISLKGELRYEKGKYFHNLFNIEPSVKIVLQYGSITDERFSKEIAMVANEFPEGYVMVMHGRSNTEYNNSLMSLIKTGKLFISTKLVDPDYISEIISSAHIGLSFYRTDDPNSALSGLSSHKLAHYTQCGLPVISNNYPSIRRLIDETKYGICVNSIKEIPHAVHAIDANYKKYSEASYKAYSDYYSIDNYIDQIVELVQ